MSSSAIALHGFFALASFLYFGLCLFYLGKASGLFSRLSTLQGVSVSVAFAPVALAWVYGCLLRVAPGHVPGIYVIAVLALPLAVFLLAIRRFWPVFRFPAPYAGWRNKGWFDRLFGIAALALPVMFFVTLAIVAQSVFATPIATNDPMEYFAVARAIFENQRLAGVYPVLDETISSGFYGPWTHPPGYVLLISWLYGMQGTAAYAGVAKFLNVYCLTAMALLLFAWSGGTRRARGFVGAYLLVLAPLLFLQAFTAHIDILRITLWTALFCLVPAWVATRSLSTSIAFGCLVGLSLFIHSLGILFFAFFIGLVVVLQLGGLAHRAIYGTVVAVVALLVVLPDYIVNLLNYGYVIGDSVAIWRIPKLDLTNFLNARRDIGTLEEKITNGLLAPLLNRGQFGLSWSIFSAFFVAYVFLILANKRTDLHAILRKATRPVLLNVLILSLLAYAAMVGLSIAIGSNLMIKNMRYLSTMNGVAAIAAIMLSDLALRYGARMIRRWLVPVRETAGRVRPVLSWSIGQVGRWIYLPVALVMAWTAIGNAVDLKLYWRQNFPVSEVAAWGDLEKVLSCSANPAMQLISSMNAALKRRGASEKPAKVLTFFPAAPALYGHFTMMSYLDPRLVEAYLAPSSAESFAKLQQLGIDYVYLPAYPMGEIENSAFKSLLVDPAYFRVEQNIGGYMLLSSTKAPQLIASEISSLELAKGEVLPYDLSNLGTFTTTAGGAANLDCYESVMVTGSGTGATLSVTGPLSLFPHILLEIDPTRQYRVSFDIRVPATSSSANTWAGLATFDARRALEVQAHGTFRYGMLQNANINPSQEWQTVSAVFAGTEDQDAKQFGKGTKFAVPVMLLNYYSGNTRTEIRNLSIKRLD